MGGGSATAQAVEALAVAAWLAEAYQLLPMPPAVLALGALWSPDAGAARSLLDGSELGHQDLLELVQDAVLGARLESAADLASAVSALAPPMVDPRNDLLTLLSEAAEPLRLAAPEATYVIVSSAHVQLVHIARHRELWEIAAQNANLSLDAYVANLRWAIDHPKETIGGREHDIDRDLVGVRLTDQLVSAVDAALRAADAVAGSEHPDPGRVLPLAILSEPGSDANGGLTSEQKTGLRSALTSVSLGAIAPTLDWYFSKRTPVQTSGDAPLTPKTTSPRRASAAFRTGTFIGVLIVTMVGGMPFGFAFALATGVQFAAARTRRSPRAGQLLGVFSALAVIAGVGLAAVSIPSFTEDVKAHQNLVQGRAAIDRKDTAAALPLIARVNLLQNESVSGRVLSACISWDLGFRDDALSNLQAALNLGFRPGEASHYRGRSCFVDNRLSGIEFVEAVGPAVWLVLPRANVSDAAGLRLMAIADEESTRDWVELHLALACLADRYDLRQLAAFYLTTGGNGLVFKRSGPSKHEEIRTCMKAEPFAKRYKYFRAPDSNIEVFVPADFASRVPAPTRLAPPSGACWARFPVGEPCNR